MFLLNSRTNLFSATCFFLLNLSFFSLSYEVILPSSFTVVLPLPSCIHTFPPVLVSCTVFFLSVLSWTGFLLDFLSFSFLLHLHLSFYFFLCVLVSFRNFLPSHLFTPLSSQLGSVLPSLYSLISFCWNLWDSGHSVSHFFFRYSCQHS